MWRLDGEQLRGELPVSLDELALGGTVTVMTPDGEAEVSIPAGTAPGRSLRLKGKGWPMKSGRGDLLLSLGLRWPSEWSEEQRSLLEQLRAATLGDPTPQAGSAGGSFDHSAVRSPAVATPVDGAHLSTSSSASHPGLARHGAGAQSVSADFIYPLFVHEGANVELDRCDAGAIAGAWRPSPAK